MKRCRRAADISVIFQPTVEWLNYDILLLDLFQKIIEEQPSWSCQSEKDVDWGWLSLVSDQMMPITKLLTEEDKYKASIQHNSYVGFDWFVYSNVCLPVEGFPGING